jgi:hypothetical protein
MKISLLALLMLGCATHATMRGSVAMKVSDTDAHVCLGNNEVKVGDKVQAFNNVCPKDTNGRGRNAAVETCKKDPIGSGIVTAILNEHYSVVSFDQGVKFTEGTIVEKK